MPQFAANLSMLFTEWPFLDRFAHAAQAGFRFVEFQFPYEVPAAESAPGSTGTSSRRCCTTCRPATPQRVSAASAATRAGAVKFHTKRRGTHLARIGHVQFADNPGRHEPGTGELNWGFLFAHLDRIGYRGQVGAEYRPATTTEAGLGWLGRYAG